MKQAATIPDYTLFGETGAFPDVVHCERIHERAAYHGWVIPPHRHSQMAQVFLIESGAAAARIDRSTEQIGPGAMLFVPPQTVHGFTFANGTEGLVLSFPLPVLGALGALSPEATARLSRPVLGRALPPLPALAAQLADALGGQAPFRTAFAMALAQALLLSVAATEQSAGPPDPARAHLRDLDRLIQKNLGAGWRPSDYANALSISTGHLSRLCRSAAGKSAGAYIEAATMTEACRLLAFTRAQVAEIGYRLGYGDPAYFSRRFRAFQGTSPSDYRVRFLQ